MPYKGISTKILRYLQEHPDRPVTVNEMHTAFPDLKRHQILSASSNLVSEKGMPVRRLKIGIYQYDSETNDTSPSSNGVKEEKLLFEQIRELSDNRVLQVDDSGELWVAQKVKF